jgi:hypothetical protein
VTNAATMTNLDRRRGPPKATSIRGNVTPSGEPPINGVRTSPNFCNIAIARQNTALSPPCTRAHN